VPELSDSAALAHAAQGDKEAFGVLYERYVDRIYTYVYYRTGNSFDAEDLTARVFLRALRHIPKYQDRGLPFSAWLYRIAHNLVANWHRDNSRRNYIPLRDGVFDYSQTELPENEVLRIEEREKLMEVIRCLPQDRQQLLIHKFLDHYSNAEIGQIMDRSEGAIKSLYHRTLLALRDEFDRRAIAYSAGKATGNENQRGGKE